jgi:hypothetical protein
MTAKINHLKAIAATICLRVSKKKVRELLEISFRMSPISMATASL